MKKSIKNSLYFLLVVALFMNIVGCDKNYIDIVTNSVNSSGESISQEYEYSDSSLLQESGKVIHSNGGPEEFFETPWLNPGTCIYNKALYSHLIVADDKLKPIPNHPDALATYKVSSNGKKIIFTLKDNIFWHNGVPITPEDIKWSIEFVARTTIANTIFASTFKSIKGSMKNKNEFNKTFSGITIDGNDIIIKFNKIAPDALLAFTQFAPVPKSEFEGVNPRQVQQAPFFQHPIGSGPFKVQEINMKNYTVLAPFNKYYNGVPDFKIQLLPSSGDTDSRFVTRVKSGNLDYGYTKSISDLQEIEGTPGITVTSIDGRYTRLFYLNKFARKDGSPSPLFKKKVRQALRYAVDMKTICDNIMNGYVIPADVLIQETNAKASGLNKYEYNPELAKKLLAEAKWNSDTVIKVVYYYKDKSTVDFMKAIQGYFAAVGVKMEYQLIEGDLAKLLWTAPHDRVNGPRAVDWDLCYGANAASSLHEYYDRYHSNSSVNSHTPADSKLDELIDATNVSVDVNKQLKAFRKLTEYENENVFTWALYYQPMYLITSDKMLSIRKGAPQYCINWDIQDWKVR
ncbi:MAG: ABC transporter substrate-binding protein [Catonella sp.]|uniref:ABC transporter substrate-binding protein n=1 Tax=Catonella sp. TaxID=2382125 RepID=UPI003FA16196